MFYRSEEVERQTIIQVAGKMAAAARTAPKGCGIDNIETLLVDGEEKDALSAEMRKIGGETGADFYTRDAANVDNSACVILIGVKNIPIGLPNCGNCGFVDCAGAVKSGANCAFNLTDLGIAVGSAVSVAMDNRIDNRVMFSAGKGALRLGYLSEKVRVCYGIPLSTHGKSIYFDR